MSGILKPGAEPPILVPYCSFCELPVEYFNFDVVSSPYYVGIHGHCCDHSNSIRLPVEELFRLKRSKEKLFLIVARGRNQQRRELKAL